DRTGRQKAEGRRQKAVSDDELEAALANFRGEIEQTPPMYSAKKVDGKKLYELARQGIEIERKAVKVTIYDLEIISPPGRKDAAKNESKTADAESGIWNLESEIRVVCSAGTYIRTLAEDIGKQLGTGAHLAELRRTKAGKFDLAKAVTIEELETIVSENRLNDVLISMNTAVSHLPQVVLNEAQIRETINGKRLRFENAALENNQTMRMIDERENLIAVGFYVKGENSIQPKLVLV
ncbi:MAG: tRNA pseudouridine(55) synthase TruB, partial [Pyrinomonadaceae bacterium]|nr:tRNA pseudouridine(55) synthase TruB [Pyrinomonadaceae bacterium]